MDGRAVEHKGVLHGPERDAGDGKSSSRRASISSTISRGRVSHPVGKLLAMSSVAVCIVR